MSEPVYQRLIKLMARAFHAAMLAKMMLSEHDVELQEEVFIASLLYHLGESAFWSTGCDETVALDESLSQWRIKFPLNPAFPSGLGISPNRKRLLPRIVLGEGAEKMKNEFIITLQQPQCLFCDSIALKKPMFVDDPASAKWRLYMVDADLKLKISATGFMIAPLIIEEKVIGMFYADRASSERTLTLDEFDDFIHFTQLANVCLGVSMG